MWLTRIPENNKTDSRNLVLGTKKYKEQKGNDVSDVELERAAQYSDIPVKQAKQSEDFTSEIDKVPLFLFRTGDRGIEGSNNTLFLMSRDRITDPASGEKDESGTIFLVAGRKDVNLDLKEDKSIFLLSMKSDADGNMDITKGDSAGAKAVIAMKSDEIRIVAREGMKIIVNGGKLHIESSSDVILKSDSKITLDCNSIEVGTGGQKAVKGETLVGILGDVVQALLTDMRPSPMGPVAPASSLQAWGTALSKIQAGMPLSDNVKLK
jgi:hypothetical protein